MNVTLQRLGSYILAGGLSSRMGRDKSLVELGGVPLVVRAARVLGLATGSPAVVVARAANLARFDALGLVAIADRFRQAGPLGGIVTGLGQSSADWNLIIGCDLPFLTQSWLEYLVTRASGCEADAIVPQSAFGLEPLCAMYRRRTEPILRAALETGARRISEALSRCHVVTIAPSEVKEFDSHGRLFKNMNTPGDLAQAEELFTESR